MKLRIRHALASAALAGALALIVASCGGDDDSGGEGGENDYTIGVDLSLASDPFFVAMQEGIEAEAQELGVETLVTYSDYNPSKQIGNIEDFVTRGVDGILASPADVEAAIPAFEQAQQADIPIMSIADHTDPSVETSFIGAPWGEFGADIAEWTCDEAGGKGDIAMIKGPAGVSFVEEMEDGYKEYISSECPGMSIAFEVNVDTTRQEALKAAQDALTDNPELTAIFTQIDDMGAGAIQALQEGGRLGEVIVTGFNGDKVGYDLVKAGEMDMTIALEPYQWGRLGVSTLVDYLNGGDVEDLVRIDSVLLDETTIDEYSYEEIR